MGMLSIQRVLWHRVNHQASSADISGKPKIVTDDAHLLAAPALLGSTKNILPHGGMHGTGTNAAHFQEFLKQLQVVSVQRTRHMRWLAGDLRLRKTRRGNCSQCRDDIPVIESCGTVADLCQLSPASILSSVHETPGAAPGVLIRVLPAEGAADPQPVRLLVLCDHRRWRAC